MSGLWRDGAPGGCRHRLICLPFAGGGASMYRPWRALLRDDVELVRVQPPGREERLGEPALRDMPALVACIDEVLRPVLADGLPFTLFGHSLGGLAAHALTIAWQQRGARLPVKLVISASRPPQVPDPDPIAHLDNGALTQALARRGGTPPGVLASPQVMALFLPTLRADLGLAEAYHLAESPPLAVPLIVCGGLRDPIVSADMLKAWEAHRTASTTLHWFEAGHFYVASHAARLIQCMGLARP